MQNKIYKIFKKNKNIIIGAIHLPPLLGYLGYPGLKITLKNALSDLRALEKGGVDGVIFENNYDIPHKILVNPPTIILMTLLGQEIRKATNLPVGISVLWNDYKTALSIAKILGLQFVRIPVFVDKVKTSYGIVEGYPKDVLTFRAAIQAEDVLLFTDIHVKHAELLSKHNLAESAKLAIRNHSDALIVTGRWTGEMPDIEKLENLKREIKNFPILAGSGANQENISSLLDHLNGVIVSTSLKEGKTAHTHVNRASYQQRISSMKVRAFVAASKK